MDIDDLRRKIDHIDQEILKLLHQRAQCALEIGKLKRSKGKPICDSEREEEILNSIIHNCGGPLPKTVILELYRKIIAACRTLQEGSF